jgi:hypothetical protein
MPTISLQWTNGTIVHAENNTSFALEQNMMNGDTLLHVRDDGFGWLHYTMSREDARKLGQNLIAAADTPMPSGGSA